MDYLDVLENESIHIIREAYHSFSKKAVLWSIGKDSTTLIWLLRKAFFGRIPFPVVHIDTGYKFKQIYEFRDRFAKEWGLDLHIIKNRKAVQSGVCPQKDRLECCTQLSLNKRQNDNGRSIWTETLSRDQVPPDPRSPLSSSRSLPVPSPDTVPSPHPIR